LKDSLLVRAIDRLRAQGVIAIGIDFYRDKGVEPGAALLRQRIRHDPRLVTIFNAAEGIPSPPGTPTQQKSFNDLIVDADGVVRRDLVHVEGQPPEVVSLPLRLFELAQGNQRLRDHFKGQPGSPLVKPIPAAIAIRTLRACSACWPITSPIVFWAGVLVICLLARSRPLN
jgi:adenylate cyclase